MTVLVYLIVAAVIATVAVGFEAGIPEDGDDFILAFVYWVVWFMLCPICLVVAAGIWAFDARAERRAERYWRERLDR